MKNQRWPDLEEVILVWKTHCDIGYTHPVPEVLSKYREGMMDGALTLIDESAQLPEDERFVWVLPAWVMELVLDENQDPVRRARIEQAIRDGRLVWHALPFTFQSEAGDIEELVRGLECGSRLARRFGQPLPTDAKLTDVPSQAWALPMVLSHAGVKFVHIGVNCWSPGPDVPHLFWWEGPDGSRVLTGYMFHDYGWPLLPPDGWPHKTWLAIQVTGDNQGPPTPQKTQEALDTLHRELPGVRVRYGRPSDFADAIIKENTEIPVVRATMPDTWTHGQMSMPVPTQTHRQTVPVLCSLGALDTQLGVWGVPTDAVAPVLEEGYEQGVLFTEHTWGICGPAFGVPTHEEWRRDLAAGKYEKQLDSFAYHAGYADKAWQVTQHGLTQRIAALAKAIHYDGPRVVVYNPLPWVRDGEATVELPDDAPLPASLRDLATGRDIPVSISGRMLTFVASDVPAGGYRGYACTVGPRRVVPTLPGDTLETAHFRVTFDTRRGGIASLVDKADGRELAETSTHALGQFMHERFCKDNVDQFMKAYCQVFFEWYGFPYFDFNKPKLDPAVSYAAITPANWTLKIERDATGDRAVLTTLDTCGLARSYTLTFFFPTHTPCVDITWRVTEKRPDLIPEGGWLCLPLAVGNPVFRVSHLGAPFNPKEDLIPGCNRHLFSVDSGITVRDGAIGSGVGVASADLPLWSIGEPGLWKYSTDYVPTKPALFVNLYNNQWNTNYPLWVDGSWSATVRLWPVAGHATEEASLFTPAWELRQGLSAGYAEGSSGPLPVKQAGLTLSRKGVRVTAYCPNPDGPGTLLRVWEQAGRGGEVVVSGLAGKTATPVNLRGETTGAPLPVNDGILTFNLPAYAPASFSLDPERVNKTSRTS